MIKRKQSASTNFPLSRMPILQVIPDAVRDWLINKDYSNLPTSFHPEDFLFPSECNCGAKWKQYDEFLCTGRYYSLTFSKSIAVYVRKCINSRCLQHFDGQTSGVFNYSGETLVSYSLMQDFQHCCINGGMSWQSYLSKTSAMYAQVFCKQSLDMPFMSHPTFTKVLFKHECFDC